jgi:hypothetical protein
MPAKSKSQQRLMGMVHACQKSGKCASEKVKKMAGSMKDTDAKDFAETKHKGLPEKVKESRMTFREFILEGYKVLPPIEDERYQKRQGLEGPFRTRSGKVVYYDPKEGKYYDPDSDFFLSHDEYEALDR